MPSWYSTLLAANPELAARRELKRSRHGVHFLRDDGLVEAHLTGAPVFYDPGDGVLAPIDSDLVADGDHWHVPGLKVRIQTASRRIRPAAGLAYAQTTLAVGIYDLTARRFSRSIDLSSLPGEVQGDSFIISRSWGEYRLRVLPTDGIAETLRLDQQPPLQAGRWYGLQTLVEGFPDEIPDGEITEFHYLGRQFHGPRAQDADGEDVACRRYVARQSGLTYLYTLLPAAALQTARYPILIDPDFTSGTADGWIRGFNANYTTARSTSASFSTTETAINVGQRRPSNYEISRGFLVFDTSSIGAGATVTQVNLKLTVTQDDSDNDFDLWPVRQDWSAQNPIGSSNREAAYDNCLSGTADDNKCFNTSGISTNSPITSGNLSTSWINKTGSTYYSLRDSRDLSGTPPTSNYDYIECASANHGTSNYRPTLVVAYTVANPLPGITDYYRRRRT